MAVVIARALDGDPDVVLVRKLRAPGQPELAIGAVDETGHVVRGQLFDIASDEYIGREVGAQLETLRRRRELYTRARAPYDPGGRIVIVVDDGIATGSSMLAAIRSIRARNPRRIIVATGVAPHATLAMIRAEADEVVCLQAPDDFYAVGQFFEDFSEVSDDMVVAALASARPADHAAECPHRG